MTDSPKQRIARERSALADVAASADAPVLGSRSQPRTRRGAQEPAPDDIIPLPDVVELTAQEVQAMRGHLRKSLTAARKAASYIGADHTHNVRQCVETAQRETRAAFDVLDRAVRRARRSREV